MEMQDTELIAKALKDRKYFGKLYEKYFKQIFRFIFNRLGGNEAETSDLTQLTFMKAMLKLSTYEDRGFPFSSWLYRIAHNEVNQFFRKQKGKYTVEINERTFGNLCSEVSESKHMSTEEQEKLVSALNRLPQEQLDLIELRFFQEFSFKEIAEIYSITEASAKMRVYRILDKLNQTWNQAS
jgi:RNA polymerase sigma-70 factor (ECF subfamily)